MKVKIAGILLAGLLAACGSDDDDGDGQIVPDAQVAADLDGDYSLTAPATTEFGTDGGECGDGSTGNVADDGAVSGGFALSGENVVMFVGTIADDTVSGTWEDNFGCMGTWGATLNT